MSEPYEPSAPSAEKLSVVDEPAPAVKVKVRSTKVLESVSQVAPAAA